MAVTYLALAFVPFAPAWIHGPTRWMQSGGTADAGQAAFFLGQFPAALIHGVNPLANTWTNWPFGANYMDNTSVPLLGLLMSPVTLWAGPILSVNLLFTLTVWADCVVCYLVVARLVRRRWAAFVAGLLYGFSPMATAAGASHEHVLFDLLTPIAFLLLWRLVTGEGRPVRTGMLLGLALAAQLYIFQEPLADCAVVGGLGLVAASIAHRRQLACASTVTPLRFIFLSPSWCTCRFSTTPWRRASP